ncbi:hypothetical protein AAMO2058_000738300 [Amorphochlora amoebiformis]
MGSRQSSASIEEKGVLGYSEKDIEIGRAVGTGYLAKLVSGKDKGAFVVVKARSTRDSKWFLKERSRLETLRHENVVGILGFIDKGDFRVLWEYCDESSIYDLLEHKHCADELRMQYAVESARGLEAIHSLDMLHLRLRPKNILLNNNTVKLSDYKIGPNSSMISPEESKRTKKESKYHAPEYLKHTKASFEADVYSLGMCMKYIWFRDRGEERIPLHSKLHDKLQIITKIMLRFDPKDRPSARHIRSRLEGTSEESTLSNPTNKGDYQDTIDAFQILASPHVGAIVPKVLPEWYIRQQQKNADGLGILGDTREGSVPDFHLH